MRASHSCEICVVGGGPAGAAVARRLAQLGHDVSLIERATFPRDHIGESLPPGILPLLDALGVRERIENGGFLRSREAVVHWSEGTAAPAEPQGEAGFQVDRGRFDSLLLEAAREAGVNILQPARVVNLRRHTDGGWRFEVQAQEGLQSWRAGFLIDAGGKRGLLPGRKRRASPATLALYGYWEHPPDGSGATLVEAGKDAWYWGAPLPDGRFNACVFIDPKACQADAATLEGFYRQSLAQSRLLAPCLERRLLTPVQACNASAYVDEDVVAADFIKVGEAAFGIDPLSSQGVQIALSCALQASIVVHTLCCRPAQREAALTFYRERVRESLSHNRVWAARFYAEQDRFPASGFWRQRAMPPEPLWPSASATAQLPPREETLDWQQPVRLCDWVRLAPVPVLQDDWVVERAALMHPSLVRPVAFLGRCEIVPLLASIGGVQTPAQLLALWQRWLPVSVASEMVQWLWRQRILVPVAAS